jgi:DNA-binding transcriptional ArsR family regulator
VAAQESKKRKFAPGVNEKVFKVLSHPLRGHIFILLRERVAAPSELAELLGERVENVAYHCRQMAKPDIGVIELVATDNQHGGTKHYYRATARPLLDTEEWAEIPKPVRELETTRSAQLIVSDLSTAIKEGTFDSHDARSLLRSPMVLDSQGIHESAKVMMEALDKHSDIQARASQRLAESGKEGTNFRAILLAFPMPSRP